MPAPAVLSLLALPALFAPPAELTELVARAASQSPSQSTLDTLRFHAWSTQRWRHEDPTFSRIMRARGMALAGEVAEGRDPFPTTTGIVYRAMQSPFAPGGLRPYGLYVPPSYDRTRQYPLFVLLRGGTSDHMSLLRQMLGYPNGPGETKALIARRPIASSRLPDLGWLVATPSGYGNTAFGGIGEEEVLEVVDDVVRHYSVDPDRIVLAGVSRGGYAAVDLGVRFAGRFAAVVDICGFADPVIQRQRNLRERPLRGFEQRLLSMVRPIAMAERTLGTPFYFVVGGRDPGTLPIGLKMLARRLDEVGGGQTWLEWPNAYHSVWVPAFRDGHLLRKLDSDGVRRGAAQRVVLVAGLYRDAEQRWVRVEQMERFGARPARIDARVVDGGHRVLVRTDNVEALRLGLDQAPSSGRVEVVVDEQLAYSGPARPVGLVKGPSGRFAERPWTPPAPGLRKVRGSSGPLEDRDHALTAYVYGTGVERSVPALRGAAERAARGGFGGGGAIWRQGTVLPDAEYDPARLPPHHLALYGHAGENAWTAKVASGLPIRVGDGFVELRGRRLDRPGDGVRMIHPNPLDPTRYVEVVAAVDADDVLRAVKLPDLLPDYVVFSRKTFLPTWQHLLHVRAGFHEAGFFDELWRLVPEAVLRPARPGSGLEALP